MMLNQKKTWFSFLTVGVKDLVIIETPDALLVCQKEKAQEVKKIVEILEEKGKKEYL